MTILFTHLLPLSWEFRSAVGRTKPYEFLLRHLHPTLLHVNVKGTLCSLGRIGIFETPSTFLKDSSATGQTLSSCWQHTPTISFFFLFYLSIVSLFVDLGLQVILLLIILRHILPHIAKYFCDSTHRQFIVSLCNLYSILDIKNHIRPIWSLNLWDRLGGDRLNLFQR